jgi:hypothetical protein
MVPRGSQPDQHGHQAFYDPVGCRLIKDTRTDVQNGLGRAVPALLVLSSLLVAKNVPLEFPRAPSARQYSISAWVTFDCLT